MHAHTQRRWWGLLLAGISAVGAAVLLTAAPASAHVVPSTTVELHVHDADVVADLVLPTEDLVTASGIDVPTDGTLAADTAEQLEGYVTAHIRVTSQPGSWDVRIGDLAATETQQWGTGSFPAITATATLVPPAGASTRSFTLDYDVIVHQVVTADVYVVLSSDDEVPGAGARNLGGITLDTRTGTIAPLTVDLDEGSAAAGFAGMVHTGISHIAEGTDHQLFLLTLLLPAPLLAARQQSGAEPGRHWRDPAPTGRAAWRITTITAAFTVGHSVTLALGALGLPVPQQPVEAAIAVSILVAAAHAVRPLFPGREPLVAGAFGLVHGLAFSTTLSALDLSGSQLVWSLLGFNVGIELAQLAVVLLVLPPLVMLARTPVYPALRTAAASLTAVAAVGWLLARVGLSTPLGVAADSLGPATPWVVLALWMAAAVTAVAQRSKKPQSPSVEAGRSPSGLTSTLR